MSMKKVFTFSILSSLLLLPSTSFAVKATISRFEERDILDTVKKQERKNKNLLQPETQDKFDAEITVKKNNEDNENDVFKINNNYKESNEIKEQNKNNSEKSKIKEAKESMELLEAEENYKKNKNETNKFALVIEYENLAHKICLPTIFSDFTFKPEQITTECSNMIKKIKSLYKNSPTVICIETGYESKECKKAYTHIKLTNSLPSSNKENSEDITGLSDFFDKLDKNKVPKLQKQLDFAVKKYNTTKKAKDFVQIFQYANKIATNLCLERKEFYSGICDTCTNEDQEISDVDIFKGISLQKEEDKVKEKKIVDKIIYLPENCQKFLSNMQEFDATYPYSICLKEGTYSPQCIKAREKFSYYIKEKYKIERNAMKGAKKPLQDNKGFDTF